MYQAIEKFTHFILFNYDYPGFASKETEAPEQVKYVPEATKLSRGRARFYS